MSGWRSFPLALEEANLALILPKGQAFRWQLREDGSWLGVANHRLWHLRQDSANLHFRLLLGPKQPDPASVLRSYLGLSGGPALSDLYAVWSKNIAPFGPLGKSFPGVRLLRQDPVETLFAFICSSNNNIGRISKMVTALCREFGTSLGWAEDEEHFDFPPVERLTRPGVDTKLRALGFGYRAKFVHSAAQVLLAKGGLAWLESLRALPYDEAATALVCLPGVGRKVADCVLLSSLDHADAVPLDVHVLALAWRHHAPSLKKFGGAPPKGLSDGAYKAISSVLREAWSPKPGWAQAVLFTSDLRSSRSETTPPKGRRAKQQKEKKEVKEKEAGDGEGGAPKRKRQSAVQLSRKSRKT